MRARHFITGITFITAITLSCCGQKAVTEETNKITEVNDTKFESEGYTAGTIVQSKVEGDCEWTIKLADGRYLDPMTMDKNFMKNDAKVWVKFNSLRRMNRCDKGIPIAITDILEN